MSFNLSAVSVFFLYECGVGLVMDQIKYPGYDLMHIDVSVGKVSNNWNMECC